MRVIFAVAAIYCTAVTSPASGERTLPYKAFVTANDVYVRSGPGQSYYPTDKLKAGREVEVYRHDPGGWCAIRPVKGSFSWVSDRYLQGGKDDLAIVTADGVASRVGSRFSDIRDVIQIRLHKGEVVEVLDCVQTGSRKWYKITPPSGEFRWVAGKYLDPDYPKDGIRKTGIAENNAKQAQDEPVDDSQPGEPAAFVRQSLDGEPAGIPAPGDIAKKPRPLVAPADRTVQQSEEPPPGPRTISPEEFRAEMEDLDLRLSTMVIEEPTVWSFGAMRRRAQEMFNLAETAIERGRARALMNKLARFADIKQRYGEMVAVQEKIERAAGRLAALDGAEDPAAGLPHPLEDRFDGVGQLTRVVSPKTDSPRFALVDEQGEVRCYVSPAPGVKLQYYLGRRVGVTGNRGYMPEQRAHHVMARHVNLLEGQMR